jgi:hypothetical protein
MKNILTIMIRFLVRLVTKKAASPKLTAVTTSVTPTLEKQASSPKQWSPTSMKLVQHPAKKRRTKKMKDLHGMCYHTSGRGIVSRALKNDVPVIDLALEWYGKKGSVHGVVDYDGTIYQLQEWDVKGAHVGVSSSQRRAYLNGTWVLDVHDKALTLWNERWPDHKSPQHLYPTKSPNDSYIGIEFIPLPQRDPKTKLWFTQAQMKAARDLWNFHKEDQGWCEVTDPTVIVGHEDLSITRWDRNGGWDPGAMRDQPRFDWEFILD